MPKPRLVASAGFGTRIGTSVKGIPSALRAALTPTDFGRVMLMFERETGCELGHTDHPTRA